MIMVAMVVMVILEVIGMEMTRLMRMTVVVTMVMTNAEMEGI